MGFVKNCLKNYFEMFENAFDFKGVTSRSDYWRSQMVHGLIFAVILTANLLWANPITDSVMGCFLGLSILPVFTINLRRIRDTGWNPIWITVFYIPIVSLPFSIFVLTRKTEDTNPNLKLVPVN